MPHRQFLADSILQSLRISRLGLIVEKVVFRPALWRITAEQPISDRFLELKNSDNDIFHHFQGLKMLYDKLFLDNVTPEISLDMWKPLISEEDLTNIKVLLFSDPDSYISCW